MSRAATSLQKKHDQKAAMALKKAEDDKNKALGLTSTVAKQIKGDTVLCIICHATAMGPKKCECTGGRTRPGADYDPMPDLIQAANERHTIQTAAKRAEAAKHQGAVAKDREKNRAAKDQIDMTEVQGDGGTEMVVAVEFPVGKLGMDIDKNAVVKVHDEGSASEGKVKPGWIIQQVNDVPVAAKKEAIIKAITTIFKGQKPATLKFRVPVGDGYWYCRQCDKFIEEKEFDSAQIEAGPGKMMCAGCEEFAEMF